MQHIFIRFPIDLERFVFNEQDHNQFQRELIMILDRIDCERDLCVYFEESNKNDFLSNLDTLSELVQLTGFSTPSEVIALLLRDMNVKDWESNPLHEPNDEEVPYYRIFTPANRDLTTPTALVKEVSERLHLEERDGQVIAILLDIGAPVNLGKLFIIRSSRDTAKLLEIEVACTFQELERFVERTRSVRVYNAMDNRHIIGHPDYRQDKSPLLGGQQGKENAARLLMSALGDRHDRKYLINFDPVNNCYIRFEDENAQNQYHGYHLVRPYSEPPEKDGKAEREVSKKILRILDYRREIA